MLNAPGTNDSDYRGEVQVLLVNLSAEEATLQPLERIAQLVVAPWPGGLVVFPTLDPTARGAGGLGSTGRH